MTVSTTTNRASYSGNGSTTAFAYGFKIFADADLTVIIRSSAGVETTKTLTTHYTVSGAGTDSGGNVTFTTGNVPASGETVVILRKLTLTQATDYVANDPFPAESHEDALDRLTMIAQQHDEAIGRALKVSQTNVIATSEFTTSATDRANKLLSFDGSGDLTVTEGKVDTVTASVSAVSAGGSPTASATYTASSGALALAFGLVTGNTGATGNSAGMQLTFSNSTSDADPGAGKLALNNGTVASVTEMYFDDVDDNGATISTFVQSFDDISNATARGIISIEKEGTPATFALFKVTGAVTNASGYTKVPVGHLASNGTFSNADGIRVDFNYSGADGAGNLTNIVEDTTPQLGGDLDMNGQDIVTTSNATIDLAPNGTGTVVVKGNTNPGTVVFNCEANTHGQTVKAQPHSASVTNTLTLPPGGDAEIVSTVATQQLTNKTIPDDEKLFFGTGNDGYIEYDENGDDRLKIGGTNIEFEKSVIGATDTDTSNTGSVTLDFAANQNFVLTLTGAVTLANPTTEQVGQSGFIVLIQDGTGSRTLSLGTDYETAGGSGITLSTAASATDIVPYVVAASGRVLLGAPQLAFA
jgi:hypothetical protein